MLKSSYLLSLVVRIFRVLSSWYEGSIFHKALAGLGRVLRAWWSGSVLSRALSKISGGLASSWTYRALRGLFGLVNTIIVWVQKHLAGPVASSGFFGLVGAFDQAETGLAGAGISSLVLGLGLIIIYLITGRTQALFGPILVFLGLVLLALGGRTRDKVRSSYLVRSLAPLYKLFLSDEEAEEWKL